LLLLLFVSDYCYTHANITLAHCDKTQAAIDICFLFLIFGRHRHRKQIHMHQIVYKLIYF